MSSISTSIKFTFYGPPKPQQRHRTTRKGGMRQYDPSVSQKATFIEAVQEHRPEIPWDCPIAIKIECFQQRPKSHYGSRKGEPYLKADAPNLWSTKGRADWDNLGKLVCDAMNGIFYEDDGQIAVGLVIKRYSDVPRTIVTLKRLDPHDRRWIDFKE